MYIRGVAAAETKGERRAKIDRVLGGITHSTNTHTVLATDIGERTRIYLHAGRDVDKAKNMAENGLRQQKELAHFFVLSSFFVKLMNVVRDF